MTTISKGRSKSPFSLPCKVCDSVDAVCDFWFSQSYFRTIWLPLLVYTMRAFCMHFTDLFAVLSRGTDSGNVFLMSAHWNLKRDLLPVDLSIMNLYTRNQQSESTYGMQASTALCKSGLSIGAQCTRANTFASLGIKLKSLNSAKGQAMWLWKLIISLMWHKWYIGQVAQDSGLRDVIVRRASNF